MTTTKIAPARLSLLCLSFFPVAMAASGCDSGACQSDGPCLDVAAIEKSQVSVQLLPDTAGREGVAVSVALPDPPTPGECWQIPFDFVRANGHAPTEISVSSGDQPFSRSCASEQSLVARFDIPITPDQLGIMFVRDGRGVPVNITRPVPAPVDVTVPETPIDRHATFPVMLTAAAGSLPTGPDCWSAVFGWIRTERFESPTVHAKPTTSGLVLQLGFPVELDVPAGAGVLQLLTRVGPGCEPPPTATCPDLAGCSVTRVYGRRLGPFPLTLQ